MRVDIIKKTAFAVAAFVLFFWVFALVTSPKKQIFYYADTTLQKSGFSVSQEDILDYWFFCVIKEFGFSNGSGPLLKSKKALLLPLGIVNVIKLTDTNADGQWKGLVPWVANDTYILHSVFEPTKIRIFAFGDFGKANVSIGLSKKNINLIVYPTDEAKQKIPMNIFKEENGGLRYETVF